MKDKLLFGFLFSLLLLSFINAAPPVTTIQSFSEGFVIEDAPTIYIKANTNFTLNFFVYNISNGVNVGGDGISCTYYIAENEGNLIFQGTPASVNGYYSLEVDGGNFSQVGHYPYGIYCNDSSLGGPKVGFYEVTPNGIEPISEGKANIVRNAVLAILAISIFFFILSFRFEDFFRLLFITLAFLFLFVAILQSQVYLEATLYNYTDFIATYGTFLLIVKTIVSISVTTLVLYSLWKAYSLFNFKRGFND